MLFALLAAAVIASGAGSANKPVFEPTPTWVRPTSVLTESKSLDAAPVHLLLSDQQIDFTKGRRTVYTEIAFSIQTPQGLAAGNISLPWRPETDVLTVHKLLIRRGDKLIDVLASGQTFTVLRREQNLEDAVLDGVLTANIQPEGLQVGDVLDLAISVSSSDPNLQGHVEDVVNAWNGVPIRRAHLRAQWPASLSLHLRQTGSTPPLTPVRSGGEMAVEATLEDVQPIVPPKGAPARYRLGRLVEMTDLASWADLSRLMSPLYDNAAAVPQQGPLHDELARIQAQSSDPKARAGAALTLVQSRVRYVALAMGAGSYVPADASTTWSRRFGDCKGKTVLLLALLRGMGIEAEPVVVSTAAGDGLDARLPLSELFNHVLVRARVAGRTYWLDGTRTGDTRLDRLRTPYFGWGLPLSPKGADLVRMLPPPLDAPDRDTTIAIDARSGIAAPAPTRVETILNDEAAVGMNAVLASLSGPQRDQALREFWRSQYDFIDVDTTSASYDEATGQEHIVLQGRAKLDWGNGNYQTDGTDVGYRADFTRGPGPEQDAPFAVNYPYYTRVQETIQLPPGFKDLKLGSVMEVHQTAGGVAYSRHATMKNGVFSIEKTERSIEPEFPAKDALAEQAALRTLADHPATLTMPVEYTYTGKDLAAVRADVPTTSEGYVSRAKIFIERNLRGEALQDYDKAVQLDPNNAYAWANRGITRVQAGDLAGARSDLAKAEAIEPSFVQNFIGRGMLADAEHRPADAVVAYSNALKREPTNSYALGQRAVAYAALGQSERSMGDLAALVDANPDDPQSYLTRGNAYLDLGRYDDALRDFDKAVVLAPGDALAVADRGLARVWKADYTKAAEDLDVSAKLDRNNAVMLRARGLMAERKGAYEDAVADYTRALTAEPGNAFALGRRAVANQAAGHEEAALQDAQAALALNPRWRDMRLLRATIFYRRRDEAGALQEAVALQTSGSDEPADFVGAANIYAVFHRPADAEAAYDRALKIKPEGFIYLNRGLNRPKGDIQGRLSDFDAALRRQPDLLAAVFAKAALQVMQGDYRGAVATYSAALERSPNHAVLLADRGVAYARAGEAELARRDFEAARAKAVTAQELNNICWSKATAGVALESALADCDAALKKASGQPDYLDSRGLVLLRLGRLDEARADYDLALARKPLLATSLLGRAIVSDRKGDVASARSNLAAALQADPDIEATFAAYGVRLKVASSVASQTR